MSDLIDQLRSALEAGDLETALSLAKNVTDVELDVLPELSPLFLRLGQVCALHEMWSKAANYYGGAAHMAFNLGSAFLSNALEAWWLESQAWLRLAFTLPSNPKRVNALNFAQAAAQRISELAVRTENRQFEHRALATMGTIHANLGAYSQAEHCLGNALILAYADGDFAAIASYMTELGTVKLAAGQERYAEHLFRFALQLSRPSAISSQLYCSLATALRRQNRITDAQECAQKAVDLARSIAAQALEARACSILGHSLVAAGDIKGAIEQHLAAIQLFKQIDSKDTKMDLGGEWGNLASCYRLIGAYQAAFGALQQALRLAQEIDDQLNKAKWYDTLGTMFEEIGDWGSAAQYHQQALQLFNSLTGCDREIAIALNSLGTTIYRQALQNDDPAANKLFSVAESYLLQAKTHAAQAGDLVMEANATGNLGLVFLHTRDTEQAIYCFERAYNALVKHGRQLDAGHQLENLGHAYAEFLGDVEKAAKHFEQAISIAQQHGDLDGLRIALTRYGDLLSNRVGDDSGAQQKYEEAVKCAEITRGTLGSIDHRSGLLARNLAAYEGLIYLHCKHKNWHTAFGWVERSRSRSFLDQLGLLSLAPLREMPKELFDQEQGLLQEVRTKLNQIQQDQKQSIDKSGKELDLIQSLGHSWDKLNAVWNEVEQIPVAKHYLELRRGVPTNVDALQKLLDLHPDTVASLSAPPGFYKANTDNRDLRRLPDC